MIVISGGLVLIAALLLVLGIATPHISLVYAAIGLAIVSAVFLLIGVFQRPIPEGEPHESESDGSRREAIRRSDDPAERPARHPVNVSKAVEPEAPVDHIDLVNGAGDPDEVAADFPLERANADFETRSGATGADVLVISGRPRYHAGGCEYVDGNDDSEPLEINEARELGFTPCGACRPNETLARSAAGKEHAPGPRPTPTPLTTVSEPATASYEPSPATVAAAAPASYVAEPQHNHVAPLQQAPAMVEPPIAEPPVAVTPVALTPAPPPLAGAVPEAPVAPPAPPAPAARATRARTVLAVASTKEYHRPACEMLAGADAEEITKVAGIRLGYLACGICTP